MDRIDREVAGRERNATASAAIARMDPGSGGVGAVRRAADPTRIRVLVVDRHPAVAAGLALLIGADPDVVAVATAHDSDSAAAAIVANRPDVVIADIALDTPAAGFDLLRAFSPRVAFLLFVDRERPAHARLALDLGAAAYLHKEAPVTLVLDAMRRAARGERTFDRSLLQRVRSAQRPPSARELQVIGFVGAGHTNEHIARSLGLSVKTVESHLRRLFDRYDTANRAELALLAEREGWLELPAALGHATPPRRTPGSHASAA